MINTILSVHLVLIAALWYFINGILHTTFVLLEHKGDYNRDLLRLLMDGHVLLFSGVITFVSYLLLLKKIPYAGIPAIIKAVFMLIYCAMIFPFLKSFVTIAVSVVLLIVSLKTIF
ncbi:MAG: hypothetical protein ACK40G_18340 [Cytophagaceae bacterium]